MALAYLKYMGTSGGQYRFIADIGTNQFYQYRIGSMERDKRVYRNIDTVAHISLPVRQPSNNPFRTEFILTVPTALFDRDNRFIQLVSFRTIDKKSISTSDIVIVSLVLKDEPLLTQKELLHYSKSTSIMDTYISPETRNIAYGQEASNMSEAMFWDALVRGVTSILPAATNILKGIGGGGSASGGAGNIIKTVIDTVGKLPSPVANAAPAASSHRQPTASPSSNAPIDLAGIIGQVAPLVSRFLSPESANAVGSEPNQLINLILEIVTRFLQNPSAAPSVLSGLSGGQSLNSEANGSASFLNNFGAPPQYSEAKIAPALLAALPALMPVIEKALNPETINALGDLGTKPIKAVQDFLNAGTDASIKVTQQYLQGAERANPGVNDPSADAILMAMSFCAEPIQRSMSFTIDPRIQIDFVNNTMVNFQGKEKIVYLRKQAAHFHIKISTNHPNPPTRPIPKAIIQLMVQQPDTLKILFEKKFRLKDIKLNSTIDNIALTPEEMASLPVNESLKVMVNFMWQGKSGITKLGTFKNHYITLSDSYIFDKMEEAVKTKISLNDVVKHRAFWHKVWEGGLTESRHWNLVFDLKYCYVFNPTTTALGKMETKKKIYNDDADNHNNTEHHRWYGTQCRKP
jgi:hypothetical protein